MVIGHRRVGPGYPPLVVAEVGLAHDGSVRVAHEFIDAVANAWGEAIKFQAHYAEWESRADEPWRVRPTWAQDANRYAYWQRTAFTEAQWKELAGHAKSRGLAFILSAFSPEAVGLLDPLVDAWKVASGEITNRPLLEAIRATGKPVIISTGMATKGEWDDAVLSLDIQPLVLQCTSEYPTPACRVGLNLIGHRKLDGLSDHSGTIYPGLGAVALGAQLVEVHVKLSQYDQGFDASSSVTIPELRQLVEGARFIHEALAPVDKDEMAKRLEPMRRLFMGRAERRLVNG